jgi:hypothetical protein
MPIENWGEMTKSQIDATKIEERMTQMISEHNDDPTAHMADDQSIGLHRINDVLDHPAGAVVPDKFSFNQKEINTYFESIDSWVTLGSIISQFLKLQVGVYGNAGTDSYAYAENVVFYVAGDFSMLDNYVQFNGAFSNYYSIADLYFGMGVLDATPNPDYGLMFKISGATLYAGVGTGAGMTWTSLGALAQGCNHVFRIETLKETNQARFWVDGSLVQTSDMSGLEDWGAPNFGIYAHKTGGTTNGQFKGFVTNFLAYWSECLGSYHA